MEMSKYEKLALWMISDIYEKVGGDGINAKLIREAIVTGNTWAIDWEYDSILPDAKPEEVVTEVCNILDMWMFIEEASSERFPGFDGNRESSHASVARFFTDQMERFERFKGRTGNGVLGLDGYRRMYGKFEDIRPTLSGRHLTDAEVRELLDERIHPSKRSA